MKNPLKIQIFLSLIAILLLALLISCKRSVESQGYNWPRWRGLNGNGISKEANWNPEAIIGGPKILWKASLGQEYSNVSIENNRVYTSGSPSMSVYCLNAETGRIIWKHEEEYDSANSTPTVDSNSVYMLGIHGTLISLNKKNGQLQWKKDLVADYGGVQPFYGFSGSPIVEEDLLIITMNTSGIALDKKTGLKIWSSEKPPEDKYSPSIQLNGVGYSTPVIYEQNGKKYAILCSYKGIHSVEVKTGKLLWLFDWEKWYKSNQVVDPLVFDQKLFLVQYYSGNWGEEFGGVLFDISGIEPKISWVNKDMGSNISSPVMVNGYLYLCQEGPQTMTGSLRCLDVKTGKLVWEEPLDKRPISIMSADGKLIILSDKGTLYIAEATSSGYHEISRCDVLEGEEGPRIFYTPPVLCNGRIYCSNYAGDLICIDVR